MNASYFWVKKHFQGREVEACFPQTVTLADENKWYFQTIRTRIPQKRQDPSRGDTLI